MAAAMSTAAVLALSLGVLKPLYSAYYKVSKLLGHCSVVTTQKYVKMVDDSLLDGRTVYRFILE